MDLSVIVVSFNTKKLTLECIGSVNDEGSKVKKEIIVIDNNSTDSSRDSLKELEKEKKVRLILNNKNVGFAKAVNQGIKTSKGKYILLLNSDTKVQEGVFGKLLAFARKNENIGVIGTKLVDEKGKVQPSVTKLPTIFGAIKEYWLGMENSYQRYSPDETKPVEVEAVFGAVLLITPKALEKVGNLDERYFMYFEDLDYCRRVKKAGLKIYYLPKLKIIHYHGESGKMLARKEDQWRRLIPSSKIYHGLIKHHLINFVIRTGQLFKK